MPIYRKFNSDEIIRVNGGVGGNIDCCCGPPPGVCECDVILARQCSELTWSVNNFWIWVPDPGGPNIPFGPSTIGNTITFPTLGFGNIIKNFVVGPTTIGANRRATQICPWNGGADKNQFIKLLFFIDFDQNLYCRDPSNPEDQFNFPFNGIYFEGYVPEPDCSVNGDGEITGQYNLEIFGNPCGAGGATFNATWNINSVGPFPEIVCPFNDA